MRYRLIQMVVLGSIPVLAACGESLSPESLAGTYVATSFTLSGTTSGDVLAAGGSLTITLNADGTTTGSLFIPAELNDGEDFNASMAGTFVLAGDKVTLVQVADSFVRDIEWTVEGSQLRGSRAFGGVTIAVVLSRQ